MSNDKRRFPWPVWVGDGLLLLCAMAGFVGSFLSLYGDPDSRVTALDHCAANRDLLLSYAALFGLATLVVWSLPRFRIAAAGGLTALWAVNVLWNQTEITQGAGITVRDITTLFARRVSWGQAFSYETGLNSAQEVDAAQLFLLFLLAGLALLLGWVVVRSRLWWVTALLTLPPLLPGLLADLYPDWLPFMALAACWCAMLLTSLCRWAAPDERGKLTLIILPAAALTLAIITAIFPREGYTRPAWARKAQDDLLNLTDRLADYLPTWNDGPFQSNITYVGAAEEADLAHAGPLNYSGRTVLRVTSDYRGLMYLRGSSLAVYEGGVWKALPDGTYESYWSGQKPEISALYFPAMQEQDGSVYTVTVDNIGAVGTCVYAPYFLLPEDANESGMLPVEDAYLSRKQGQWVHTMTFVDRDPSDSGGPGRAAAFFYAGYAYDNYLDVPEDLREILDLHARQAMGYLTYESLPSINGFAQRIRVTKQFSAHLGAYCQYDAGAPAAPEGVDPVYYFLSESNRGYCMHYASAVTLMLRAVGIPARYVNGFAANITSNRQTDVPDRAAHAWVEVWIDGFGWYPVEVTPAAAFAWMGQSGIPYPDNRFEETPEPTDTPRPTETPEPAEETDQPTATLPGSGDVVGPGQGNSGPDFTALLSVLRIVAPVIGAFLFVWSVQFAVKRLRGWRMSRANTNRSALVCYGYLCQLEHWGGRTDARAVELAQKARFSQHTLTQDELDLLRYLVDRERSRLCVVPRLPMRLVFRYWWGRPKTPVPPSDWAQPQ